MLFTLYLQVLWWSWVSHPLSPQALSCSCWLVPRSLRWETLPKTEPSSTELRNVGLLLSAFAIFRSCHETEDETHNTLLRLQLQLLSLFLQGCKSLSCSVFLQCLEWSSPLDRPLYMLWQACMEILQRWVQESVCSSSFRWKQESFCQICHKQLCDLTWNMSSIIETGFNYTLKWKWYDRERI